MALATGIGVSAMFGGLGGCGLVPQTVLNLKSRGVGAISQGSYAASMGLFVLVLGPAVGQLLQAALAGVRAATVGLGIATI